MNYTEEIIKLNNRISELNKMREAESIKNAPDIIGKYFKLAYQTYFKVREFYSYDPDNKEAECYGLVVRIEKGDCDAIIDSRGRYRVDLGHKQEIPAQVFYNAFELAMMITNQMLH